MHEYSMARALVSQTLEIIPPRSSHRVRRLHLAIGPLAGVEPLLLTEAFDLIKADFGLNSCHLEIDECPLEGTCSFCHCRFEIVDFDFHCPQCDAKKIEVTQGDRVILAKIDIEEIICDKLEETCP